MSRRLVLVRAEVVRAAMLPNPSLGSAHAALLSLSQL